MQIPSSVSQPMHKQNPNHFRVNFLKNHVDLFAAQNMLQVTVQILCLRNEDMNRLHRKPELIHFTSATRLFLMQSHEKKGKKKLFQRLYASHVVSVSIYLEIGK